MSERLFFVYISVNKIRHACICENVLFTENTMKLNFQRFHTAVFHLPKEQIF